MSPQRGHGVTVSRAKVHGLWGMCRGSAFGPCEGVWLLGVRPTTEGEVLGQAELAPASRTL